ncbi:hypothetical protein EVAR_7249_1 [Eumeta japonica]|uniref:Uncharacterized protein n=1 Tax=Eumeta variegata TaxID=151549 RepID=A0A4C1T390_EUMVA|nr:hypothetical protein EVAR_7249_1 [Eumeta japonica]
MYFQSAANENSESCGSGSSKPSERSPHANNCPIHTERALPTGRGAGEGRRGPVQFPRHCYGNTRYTLKSNCNNRFDTREMAKLQNSKPRVCRSWDVEPGQRETADNVRQYAFKKITQVRRESSV